MIYLKANNEKLEKCLGACEQLLDNPKFWTTIDRHPSFEMADVPPMVVSSVVEVFVKNNDINIRLYTSKNPWSKANGYFTPARPHDINLNTRKLWRTVGSISSTIIHEIVHMADSDRDLSFGHGNNSPVGKENCAPFWIDNLAEAMIDNKHPDFNNMENITYKIPWWKRLWRWLT